MNVQNKNISLSLNERHITVLFRKQFTLAASINAMTGYSTRCSVHWFFGGKSATTSKMFGSIISVSSSDLAMSMFSKSGDVDFVVASSTEFASSWYR